VAFGVLEDALGKKGRVMISHEVAVGNRLHSARHGVVSSATLLNDLHPKQQMPEHKALGFDC
jgi:hypothetical protein